MSQIQKILSLSIFAALTALATPATAAPPGADALGELDILCANLWGLGWPLARDRDERLSVAPDALRFRDYDLVGLQEIWRGAIQHLPEGSVRLPPVQVDSGLAVAGRLAEGASLALHTFESRVGVERFKRKGVLVAQLDVPGYGSVWAFVTHLQAGPPYGETRLAQARELLALMDAAPGPALVLGDFNLHADDPLDQEIEALLAAAGLRDAALVAGDPESTYRGDNPYTWGPAAGERFDRVYLRDGTDVALEVVEVEVMDFDTPLSDHQPFRVKVQLRDRPKTMVLGGHLARTSNRESAHLFSDGP